MLGFGAFATLIKKNTEAVEYIRRTESTQRRNGQTTTNSMITCVVPIPAVTYGSPRRNLSDHIAGACRKADENLMALEWSGITFGIPQTGREPENTP